MNKTLTRVLPCLWLLTSLFYNAGAVSPSDAGQYLNTISEKQKSVTEDAMSYISAVAHGKSARKIEKRRTELINSIVEARGMAQHLQPFDGDTALKSAAYNFFNLSYLIFKEDYAKIVDMEEIAEQSYDNMEAYIMAQDKADEKLDEADAAVNKEFKAFAVRHSIHLVDDDSKLSKISEQVNKEHTYYHQVYLIFFKSYILDEHLADAIGKKDVVGAEQNKNSLLKSTEEGMQKLGKYAVFEDDNTLANACRQMLQFCQSEAKTKVSIITDYWLKLENFDKMKKAMDASSNHSKADVDAYNKSVKDMNASVDLYNRTVKELNDKRSESINNWNDSMDKFFSKHTPRYKK